MEKSKEMPQILKNKDNQESQCDEEQKNGTTETLEEDSNEPSKTIPAVKEKRRPYYAHW